MLHDKVLQKHVTTTEYNHGLFLPWYHMVASHMQGWRTSFSWLCKLRGWHIRTWERRIYWYFIPKSLTQYFPIELIKSYQSWAKGSTCEAQRTQQWKGLLVSPLQLSWPSGLKAVWHTWWPVQAMGRNITQLENKCNTCRHEPRQLSRGHITRSLDSQIMEFRFVPAATGRPRRAFTQEEKQGKWRHPKRQQGLSVGQLPQ